MPPTLGPGRVGMRVWVYHPSSQSGWRGDTPTHAYSFPPGGRNSISIPAASYSPTRSLVQYHQRWKA